MKTTEKNIPITAEIGIPYLAYPYSEVARLRIIEKKSYKEIAETMNISENHCRLCVHRAKKKLKILDKMLVHANRQEKELVEILTQWGRARIEGRKLMKRV